MRHVIYIQSCGSTLNMHACCTLSEFMAFVGVVETFLNKVYDMAFLRV